MGLRVETKQIGSFVYEYTQLPTSDALDLLPLVLRVLGPAAVSLLGQIDKVAGINGDDDVAKLSPVLASMVAQMFGTQGAELRQLSARLARRTRLQAVGGQFLALGDGSEELPGVYETHWPERWGDWAQWLWFALVVQYRSFLGALPSGLLGSLSQAPTP